MAYFAPESPAGLPRNRWPLSIGISGRFGPEYAQQAIIAEIEAEQALVNANRELIDRFEKKIQDTLARIWGDAEPDTAA